MASWGYGVNDGPDTWCNAFPLAAGRNQSPINIQTKIAKYDDDLVKRKLKVDYHPETKMVIHNVGKTIKINTKAESVITGGPLRNQHFRLEQFHLHWGAKESVGSEHTIDKTSYAAELHLVHWNATKYASFSDAVDKTDGLAVFGILIKIGKAHAGFKKITDTISSIQFAEQKKELSEHFDVSSLLPADMSRYYTYAGSLTTPPCCESVTWIVFDEVVEYAEDQLQALRSMCWDHDSSDHIINNYRPTLPLGNRRLWKSFS